jgi:hypothetical protein
MITTRLYVKAGAEPRAGADRLGEVIMLGGNVTSRCAGPQGVVLIREDYLSWIEQVERCLEGITEDHALVSKLFTDKYWGDPRVLVGLAGGQRPAALPARVRRGQP